MFEELIVRNATAGAVLLALFALAGWARFRNAGAVLGVAALVAAMALVTAMGSLPDPGWDALPLEQLGTLLAWLAYGFAGRAARPMLPRSYGVAGLVAGALLGDLAGALLVAPLAKDVRTAARVGLCAAAGGLLSPLGSPSTLLLIDAAVIAPVALPMALVAWPGGTHDGPPGSLPATGLLVTLAVLAGVFPALKLPLLGLGTAMLLVLGRGRLGATWEDTPKPLLTWLVGAALVAWAARHLGLLQQALVGLETTCEVLPDVGPLLASGAALLLSMLGGEGAAALVLDTLMGASFTGPTWELHVALALGAGVGGLGPALLATTKRDGRLRAIAPPLLLQAVAALLWLFWFL